MTDQPSVEEYVELARRYLNEALVELERGAHYAAWQNAQGAHAALMKVLIAEGVKVL